MFASHISKVIFLLILWGGRGEYGNSWRDTISLEDNLLSTYEKNL